MKIKVAKDYLLDQMIYESDSMTYRAFGGIFCPRTFKSDYSTNWIEEDVTLEKLQEYVDKGYAIRINC